MSADPDQAVELAQVNYIATVSLGLRVATALRRQGHGSLVFLSSVAAERGRAANFVYGSSKAGVDTFAQGLGDSLHGTGVHVLVVRPGFVRTRMTAGLPEAPFATTAGRGRRGRRRRAGPPAGGRLGPRRAAGRHVRGAAPAAAPLPPPGHLTGAWPVPVQWFPAIRARGGS